MMTDLIWFQFAFWAVLILGSYIISRPLMAVLGSLFGFGLSWVLYDTDFLISVGFLCVNIYLLYESFNDWDHE